MKILLVTEAGTNALSSYRVNYNGTLSVISPSVLNFQTATCWVALSENGRFAYTSNAGSHTITTYEIECDGHVSVSNVIYSTKDGFRGHRLTAAFVPTICMYSTEMRAPSAFFLAGREGKLIRTQVFSDTQLPNLGSQGLAVLCFLNRY